MDARCLILKNYQEKQELMNGACTKLKRAQDALIKSMRAKEEMIEKRMSVSSEPRDNNKED